MHSTLFLGALLALLAVCACAPADADVIQHIPPRQEPTPSAIGKNVAESGASEKAAGASESNDRVRRDLAGQESDLLPSPNEGDASPFGETSQLLSRGRIKVLPAYLG